MGCAGSKGDPTAGADGRAAGLPPRAQPQAVQQDRSVIERADKRPLPPHLRLGLTIEAMQAHLDSLPGDAVALCNGAIPRKADGTPEYPPNSELNGYVNQHMIKQTDRDISFCERLQRDGSAEVGDATVFVS